MPTITIDLTVAQAQRVAAAYELGGSPAEMLAKITEILKKELARTVRRYEHDQAIRAVVVPPLDI